MLSQELQFRYLWARQLLVETILLKFMNCMISKVKIFVYNFYFYQQFVYNCFCLDTYNVINIDDERGLDNVEWSEDGQLLAVSTSKGICLIYVCLHIF